MKTIAALITLLSAIAIWTATAQEPGRPGPRGERPLPSPVTSALDLNNDGRVDADELAKALGT